MSTQQDIYDVGSEKRPPMLNKDNYVPWSSRLLRYAKSKPNGKLLVNSIKNGPYVRRMIHEPGDPNSIPHVAESTHERTDDELTEKEAKQMEASDQAIKTILMGLPEDIYAAVDSCDTAREIWLRVEHMMKGSSIGAQEKKAKLFYEWEKFNSTEGESIESYYHRFSKLMNDFSRNKYFLEKITRKQVGHNAVQNLAALAKGNGNGNNGEIDEIKEFNANCILMENLQQALTSGTQTDKAPVYDSDGSTDVHHYENYYDNDIFNMFTQEEQYTELLEPITEPHTVQQNNSNVISMESSVEHNRGIVEQHPAIVEETRAYIESLYNNLVTKVEKANTVNRKMKETNADLTTELARYKGQEKCFEFNQAKFNEFENGYKKFVYQEQCLTKKINALHLSSAKQITNLNEEIANLNNQLSKEKTIVSYLQEERKKLQDDFKTREDEFLDKLIQYQKKIKELDNILVKKGQSIQTMYMLSPKLDSFYHTEQNMALGYQNPFYLKKAQ
ncbi:hypothetical protein Tco_0490462 [Tanacetum coccineum]